MNPTRTNAGKSEATKSTSAQSEPLKTQSARPAAKPQPAKAPAFRTEPTAPAAAKIETSRPEPAKPQPKSAAGKPASTQPVPEPAPTAPAKTTIPVRSEAPKAQPAQAQAQKPKGQNRISLEITRPGAHQVCVAGTFNEWKPEKTPLVQMGHGRWVGNLNVKPGRYEYLFVVDGQWVQDPNARESVQNPYGGQNSVLVVSA